jgi:FAD binding domain
VRSTNYEETWVALNWKISLPTEKTHPDFPLWRLGYSPIEVYDLFFPQEFRFLCNPDRPSVCGRFGLPNDRLWRFEFVVQKGEDGEKMATFEETSKIIFPYLTHPGSRYGLRHPLSYPADCIETLRSRPFSFSARSCNKWSLGRVIIAGDAAHVFPPFGGQGIASGFRDAFGLVWRLKLLHQEPAADHEQILRAWYLERKQQLERSLAATIQNGEYVTERDPLKVFVRDWSLWFQQLVPSWKRHLEKGPRVLGMTKYNHAEGLAFLPSGGLLLPQVYARCLRTSRVTFSDDLLFSRSKKGLLQLLLLPDSPKEARQLIQELRHIPQQKYVFAEEVTILIQSNIDHFSTVPAEENMTIARIATGPEFAETDLCRNRPAPQCYDPQRISKELPGMKFALVRPDRFVYAACRDGKELAGVLGGMASVLLP